MIKQTHRYLSNNEGCTNLKINFTVNKSHLISTIVLLLDKDTPDPITKNAVEKKLRLELFGSGYSFDEYCIFMRQTG